MRIIRQTVKSLVAALLYYSGILSLVAKRRLCGKAVVLTYHRVMPSRQVPDCQSNPGIIVHSHNFAKQLELLVELFHIISLKDFSKCMANGGKFPDRSCLITFDDGWIDNYEHALPQLKERHIPATIFLPFNYISSDLMFWQEELRLRLGMLSDSEKKSDRDFTACLTGIESDINPEDIGSYISKLKNKDYGEINKTLENVRKFQENIPLPPHYNRYLDWDQVSEMQNAGVNFQSHSISHRILPRLDTVSIEQELINSRRLLETRLGSSVDAIAYPNGDSSRLVESLTEKNGYRLGFTTQKGYVDKNTDAYAIPRINIHNNSSYNKPIFLCTILGIF
ncbi:Polysaccharide deacetylase [hydrothermal vent metagenome]|uniref:Polysaccharide deacetylase n=1 Tax=hydrothermal vent metagenome TaxID=652676 RepID=A0A3B0YGE1_9ZZZZ